MWINILFVAQGAGGHKLLSFVSFEGITEEKKILMMSKMKW